MPWSVRARLGIVLAIVLGATLGASRVSYAQQPEEVSLPKIELPEPAIHTAPKSERLLVQDTTWLWLEDVVWQEVRVEYEVPDPSAATNTAARPPDPQTPFASPTPGPTIRVGLSARPTSVLWDMGDGRTTICYDAGRRFDPALHYDSQQPSCSYRYTRDSTGEDGGTFTVKATIYWEITAHARGSAQVLGTRTTTSSDEKVRVSSIETANSGVTAEELAEQLRQQQLAEGDDADLSFVAPSPEPGGGLEGGSTPQPEPIDDGGFFGFVGDAFGAVAKCFDGWGGTCTKIVGVVATTVGTAALCAATVGVGCAVAAMVVGGAVQGALFCNGGSIAGCVAKGAAIGGLFAAGGWVLAAYGSTALAAVAATRVGAAVLAVARPAASRLLGLVPSGVRSLVASGYNTIGGRVLPFLRTHVSGPISAQLSSIRAVVWRRFPRFGAAARRLGAPTSRATTPPPATRSAAPRVQSKVASMKSAMTVGAKGRTTYAAAEVTTKSGAKETWVSGAGKKGYVPPEIRGDARNVRAPASAKDQYFPHVNDAERHIQRAAATEGATIDAIGATRPACAYCQQALPDGLIVTDVLGVVLSP